MSGWGWVLLAVCVIGGWALAGVDTWMRQYRGWYRFNWRILLTNALYLAWVKRELGAP